MELLKFFLSLFFLSFFLQARYTGFRDRPLHERQAKFQHSLREGNIEMVSGICRSDLKLSYTNSIFFTQFIFQSVLSNGFAFSLIWNVLENGYLDPHAMTRIDFHKERGKVRN